MSGRFGGFIDQLSMSSMVWGRGRFKVSGRKKTSNPAARDRAPNRMPGNQGTAAAWKMTPQGE
jgi:hypothetical protein